MLHKQHVLRGGITVYTVRQWAYIGPLKKQLLAYFVLPWKKTATGLLCPSLKKTATDLLCPSLKKNSYWLTLSFPEKNSYWLTLSFSEKKQLLAYFVLSSKKIWRTATLLYLHSLCPFFSLCRKVLTFLQNVNRFTSCVFTEAKKRQIGRNEKSDEPTNRTNTKNWKKDFIDNYYGLFFSSNHMYTAAGKVTQRFLKELTCHLNWGFVFGLCTV